MIPCMQKLNKRLVKQIKVISLNLLFQYMSFNNIIAMTEHFVPILLSFYIGSWSDKFGRKVFLVVIYERVKGILDTPPANRVQCVLAFT